LVPETPDRHAVLDRVSEAKAQRETRKPVATERGNDREVRGDSAVEENIVGGVVVYGAEVEAAAVVPPISVTGRVVCDGVPERDAVAMVGDERVVARLPDHDALDQRADRRVLHVMEVDAVSTKHTVDVALRVGRPLRPNVLNLDVAHV